MTKKSASPKPASKKSASKKSASKKAASKKSASEKAASKKAGAKQAAAVVGEADPRFIPVAKALARVAGCSLMESKSGALRGMMLHGKSFGMSSHGRFILKLTEERANDLIEEGVGKAFTAGAGRVMKAWIEVTDAEADWVALAKEALKIAAAELKTKAIKKAARARG